MQGFGAAGGFTKGFLPTGLLQRSVWSITSGPTLVFCGATNTDGPPRS